MFIDGIYNGVIALILFGLFLFFTNSKLSDFIHENVKRIFYFIISGIFFGFLFQIIIGIPAIINKRDIIIWNLRGLNNTIIYIISYGFCFFSVAIFEEILCRGYILKRFLKRFSPVIAIIFESLLFSLFHFFSYLNSDYFYINMLNAFMIGIFLSIMAITDGSLIRCIGFHLSSNLFELLLYTDNDLKFSRLIYYKVYNTNKLFIEEKYITLIIISIFIIILLIKNSIITNSKSMSINYKR